MGKSRTDKRLRAEVLEALDDEPGLDATGTGVGVRRGIVTLRGHMPSTAQKGAAARVALRVPGVKAVIEDVRVRSAGAGEHTDAELARTVLDALGRYARIPEDQLKAKVEDGVVTLIGELAWSYDKEHALDIVSHLVGVRGVEDAIDVKPPVLLYDVRESIRGALERAADEDAGQITIDVKGTEVTLGGQVQTWVERETAERAARATPGVSMVHDRIQIKPPSFA